MGFSTGNVLRTWMKFRMPFDHVPVRGLFFFVNGNPSGVYVKISPTTCAQPAQAHANNPHFEFRAVVNRGSGNNQTSASDFAYYQGTTIKASRSALVQMTNPAGVVMEANMRDW